MGTDDKRSMRWGPYHHQNHTVMDPSQTTISGAFLVVLSQQCLYDAIMFVIAMWRQREKIVILINCLSLKTHSSL